MFFSVIIPLYNKAPYIEKALSSVATQTFEDYELIVVDDGSKDGSAEIAQNCIKSLWQEPSKPQAVRLLRQENAGVSTARNNGVAASSGDYICFLDADDWWMPTFLEDMKELISKFPEAGIYGTSYTIVNENKHKTRVAPIGLDNDFQKGYINYCQVYAKTLAMPLWTGAVSIPRIIFSEMQGFKSHLKLGEDFDLWIRIALRYKVAFLNKPLAYYNQDVDIANRGVGHLHKPESHMLWNLGYLKQEEETNPDYKQLIDNLRTYSLMPYYLSPQYRNAAKDELKKVDWDKQPYRLRKLYNRPVWLLTVRKHWLSFGSKVKRAILQLIKR